MSDVFTAEKRSWIMGRVKQKDTKPEMLVRSMIHRMGFRFRLHSRGLPGNPDVVLPRHRKVVFMHGCFWHRHADCRKGQSKPTSNQTFWDAKLAATIDRDRANMVALQSSGWEVLVVWECEVRNPEALRDKLQQFLHAEGAN